jgi:hypothetical protein
VARFVFAEGIVGIIDALPAARITCPHGIVSFGSAS